MPTFQSPNNPKDPIGAAPDSDLNVWPKETQIVIATIAIKMRSLGLPVMYHHYVNGPMVETYFFRLESSVPLAKVMARADDVALATGSESVVIVREGQFVGFQVAKVKRDTVNFNNCLFRLASNLVQYHCPILLGQTYTGEYKAIDLAEEPHALVAGSTGSGKSMFLLSAACTMAVVKKPEELKMIIVDSKMVDLTVLEGLPHVTNVCRNALDLHNILDVLLNEMRRRNSLLAGIARNIDEYNAKVETVLTGGKLPRIVLIIDEFADLISEDFDQAKAKVEPYNSYQRLGNRLRTLAQLSRASGINIVAATQRPSVQITGGDLKVNLPCRIAFKLTSMHDSKTVLKETGAEHLLGKGDMLVQTVSQPMFRAHAPWVDIDTLKAILADTSNIREMLLGFAAREDLPKALESAT
ncbi:MAG TPA: DNA translocase FtsK [Candidatus Saccharimonadales bacterium]|jgi:S-DNA-T family DNA segregation ATPase FtsK/SpoIIIE